MKNKRNKITFLILGLLLFISIGYATLSTILKINSTIGVGKASFDIHFDNVAEVPNKAEINTAAYITNDEKTEIDFDVFLPRIDDNYIFTTDIVNEGSIPGKITSIELNGLTESQKKIIKYKVYYTISKKTVAIGDYIGPYGTKNITVEVVYELDEDITNEDLPEDDMSVDCTFVIHFENGNLNEYRSRAAANRLMQNVDYFPTAFVNFGNAVNSDEHLGVYRLDGTENDDFPIYFYRGGNDQVHNHVNFGGYCWRILRTTTTGGIKLIYNGVPNENGQCTALTGSETYISWHSYGSNYKYDGSSLQYYLNTWYFENFIQNQAYLEDIPFCNDLSYSPGDFTTNCAEEYTISMANGKNQYPVGLLTAHEANLMGLTWETSSYPWLFNGTDYWTLTGRSDALDCAGIINRDGSITGYNLRINNGAGVRPVISLNSEVVLSGGDGTTTNPYTVSLG